MGVVASYRELVVWQKSMVLVEQVYAIVRLLPVEERFALSDQMRRAAVSIPSNIAEGQAREAEREFAHFLSIAQGSRAELETQLELCTRLNYVSIDEIKPAYLTCQEVGKMLRTLIRKLSTTN